MNFEDARKENKPCVYCLEFPNGMKYVGKTKNLSSRVKLYEQYSGNMNKYLSGAIDEFGLDSIKLNILVKLECSNSIDLDISLSILEIKYIRELGTIYPNGYNISLGGEVLGIPIEHITTDKDLIRARNNGQKVVLLYDLEGNFVEEFSSINRLAYDKGVDEDKIREFVGKMRPFSDKWYLRFKKYDYVPQRIEVPVYEVKERVKYNDIIEDRVITRERVEIVTPNVLAYDMNGDFVGEYKSRAEAARHLVTKSDMPYGKYTQGYILFKKESDDFPKKIEDYLTLKGKITQEYYKPAIELEEIPQLKERVDYVNMRKKPHKNLRLNERINQFDLNGNFIAQFNSIRDASVNTGIRYSMIYNCVNGATFTAKGYIWRKAED